MSSVLGLVKTPGYGQALELSSALHDKAMSQLSDRS